MNGTRTRTRTPVSGSKVPIASIPPRMWSLLRARAKSITLRTTSIQYLDIHSEKLEATWILYQPSSLRINNSELYYKVGKALNTILEIEDYRTTISYNI
jgi:hypothetical protein